MDSLIPIVFNVPEHFVRVETFVASAEAAQKVVQAFSRQIFGDRIVVDVVVVAPEPGSLRQILKVSIKIGKYTGYSVGGVWAVIFSIIQALETDVGKAAVEGFTGQSPSEIVKEAAEKIASSKEEELDEEQGPLLQEKATKEVCGLLGEILSQMSSRALALPKEQLYGFELPPELEFELADAQADVFEACLGDDLVKSIEFEDSGVPPIQRSDFALRALRPPRVEKEDDTEGAWAVSFETIVVTSPNFAVEEQENRKWKGRSQDGRPLMFTIDDQEFWSKSHRKELKFTEDTVLTVQMATRLRKGKAKELRAVRILKIDDLEIGLPLDENALSAILGSLARPSADERQGSFF